MQIVSLFDTRFRGMPSFAGLWPRLTTPSQRLALLRLLSEAIDERQPLPPLLSAWAEDERGGQRRRLHRLVQLLKDGESLPAGLEQVPNTLFDEDVVAIRLAWEMGTLPEVLRQRVHNAERGRRSSSLGNSSILSYGTGIFVLTTIVSVFIVKKILPMCRMILEDFGREPPYSLQLLIQVSEAVFSSWWWMWVTIAAIAWLLYSHALGRRIRRWFGARFSRGYRDRRIGALLSCLSETMHSGRPIPGAISTLARYHDDSALRHRLLYVRNELEQGSDLATAMADTHLLTNREQALLVRADELGYMPWALDAIAEKRTIRTDGRARSRSGICLAAVLLIAGGVVFLQAYAVFATLVHAMQPM